MTERVLNVTLLSGEEKTITYYYLNPEVIIQRLIRDGLEYSKYFVGPITAPDDIEYPIKDFRTGLRAKQVTSWKRYLLKDPTLQIFWLSMFLDAGAVNKHQRSETLWMLYDSISREGLVSMFMPVFKEYADEDEESQVSENHR